MNSRERIRAAINHQPTNRVPMDLGAMGSTGIQVNAYIELRKFLGLPPGEVFIHDVNQMLCHIEPAVRERLGVDALPLPHFHGCWDKSCELHNNAGFTLWKEVDENRIMMPAGMVTEHDRKAATTYLLSKNGKRAAAMPDGGYYFDPLPEKSTDLPGPQDLNFQDSLSDEELKYYESTAKEYYESSELAVLGPALGYGLFCINLGGFDTWLMSIIERPDDVGELLEKVVDANIPVIKQFNQAAGKYVESIVFSDDLGTQHSEWIHPDVFKNVFAPHFKRIFGWIHENTDLKVFLHCCGSIPNLIETLIDCGVDILNPVQTSAAGMDAQRLKDGFGDRLVFWGGGVDTQGLLVHGSQDEFEEDVNRRLDIFTRGGGYVFNPIHNFQAGSDPAKIVAAYDIAKNFDLS